MTHTNHATRRPLLRYGFTVVELLVVIVIIAILATVTIVVYNNLIKRGIESTLQTDLSEGNKQQQISYVLNGNYPADTSSLKKSSSTTYQYTVDNSSNPPSYCLSATNPGTANAYYISSTNPTPTQGLCSGHVQNPSSGTAPVITLQPTVVSRDYVIDSMTHIASFSPSAVVAASGTPTPTCQWQQASSSSGPWTDSFTTDATSTTFKSYNYLYYSDTWYRAVFTNSAGSATTQSFMVNAAPEP